MERPAAPAPPKPCRPILDEDPLFPRYKIRGVLAAGARRPQRFGGQDGAAGRWGAWPRPRRPGPDRTRLSRLPGPPLCWGGAKRRGSRRRRAETRLLAAKVRGLAGWELRIPEAVAAGVSPPSPRREMLLMLWSPPISSRRGRRWRWAGGFRARASAPGQLRPRGAPASFSSSPRA